MQFLFVGVAFFVGKNPVLLEWNGSYTENFIKCACVKLVCWILVVILPVETIMGRILAIDYGRKRTGIAVSDTMRMIANGLTTVSGHELLNFVLDYMKTEQVECIVIGMPKQMNNEFSENMKYITSFVHTLEKQLPNMLIEFVDERFTSVLAQRTMREAGLKKKARQNKALVDEISATIILQTYLESKRSSLV
ncbi:putative pre-16S rRNA nuclease [termite gut metagenome]|uniref:Putative pre-16S rRNA nuclease n=1 Tax=termite gut metagenome TaxID=433724 RepID=A0A5J4RKQ4_9ZZZZ